MPPRSAAPHHTSALVLFSGGQDSTTCLAQALARYPRVETLGFDYGQRHHVELQARITVLEQLRERFPAFAAFIGRDVEAEAADQLRRGEGTGRPLGDARFVAELEAMTGRMLKPGKRGPKRAVGD